jgi:predicted transcriptional regulator
MVTMKLSEIVKELEATNLTGEDKLDHEFTRCGAADLMSDVLARPTEGILLMTGLTSIQTLRTAQIAGVLAIMYVRDKRPLPEVINLAKEERIPLFSSPFSMFVCCGRLHARGLTGLDGRR